MNILIFDTETAGCKTQTLLNIGYRIINLNLTTLEYTLKCERSYLNRDLYKSRLWMINDMFVGEEKLAIYDRLIENDKIILRTLPQMLTTMCNDIAKYDIQFAYAYNAAFDIDKIGKAATENEIPNPLESVKVFDIWGYASNLICQTTEYKQWAIENEQITASEKFISTSVEAVTRFLYKDLNFIEEHTALSDIQWEMQILLECARRGADILKPMARHSYIKSGKVFVKHMILPDGEEIQFEYTDCKTKDGIEIYKM